jgi:predicted RNA-binding Zn-ribbon protein involved in translation (DUF1610 family)
MPKPKYSTETLILVAGFSTTMNEFLTNLGEQITPGKRAAMWARIGQLEIDTSHWERSPNRIYRAEELRQAVAASKSIAEVLRRLGMRPAGGSHFHISNRIKKAGLDTSHFLGQAHYRGTIGRRLPTAEVLVVLPAGSARIKRARLLRCMLEAGIPYCCASCGMEAVWHGRPITLAIDHVNGDWLDNRLANLRFLCPNCHAQTSTWCRRKGS